MVEILESFETTAGQTVSRRRDSAGRTYYVAEGEGRISAKSYAGKARHKAEPESLGVEDFVDRRDITPDVGVYDRQDTSDEAGPRFDDRFDWVRDEGLISVLEYPTEARIDELKHLTLENPGYDVYDWSIRTVAVNEDGSPIGSDATSRIRTRLHDHAPNALAADFREVVETARRNASGYDDILVDATIATAWNEA